MKKQLFFIAVSCLLSIMSYSQAPFNGLENNMGSIYRLSNAQTRSISPENFTGEKGKGGMADPANKDKVNMANATNAARDLGQGWKVNPYIRIQSGETVTLAEISGSGAIQHIWMTPTGNWRFSIIRMYWDDETEPSVECPVGDFFCMGWGEYAPLSSLAVCVNPGSAFNCYWPMPFHKKCRITMENINDAEAMTLYYQIDYTLTEVPADAGYFHAQFRRSNPNTTSVYTIADGIKGKGQFVGVYLAWGVNNNGWWGEGEIKFYLDGDNKFPTICGTGTEDYFCGTYKSQQRFGLYRWHIADPIRFEKDLKITIQDLGWRQGGRYLPQQSDISSVCFWYQANPHAAYPKLPGWRELEVY
jgi:hypothetical protein